MLIHYRMSFHKSLIDSIDGMHFSKAQTQTRIDRINSDDSPPLGGIDRDGSELKVDQLRTLSHSVNSSARLRSSRELTELPDDSPDRDGFELEVDQL